MAPAGREQDRVRADRAGLDTEHSDPLVVAEVRQRVLEAGLRRIRPALMTNATTIIALTPILWADGRGAEIMIPMALPSIGGMVVDLLTLFMVPVLYSWWQERRVVPPAE